MPQSRATHHPSSAGGSRRNGPCQPAQAARTRDSIAAAKHQPTLGLERSTSLTTLERDESAIFGEWVRRRQNAAHEPQGTAARPANLSPLKIAIEAAAAKVFRYAMSALSSWLLAKA